MDKSELELLISQGFSSQQIADKLGKGKSTVKYHINKYGLKTNPRRAIPDTEPRACAICKEIKDASQFYKIKAKKIGRFSYCIPCAKKHVADRQRTLKQQCVDYKGGKCESCGYNRYLGALDFHHKDQTQKDFSISHVGKTEFCDKIKRELDKCQLLCSNCHRETHGGFENEKNDGS